MMDALRETVGETVFRRIGRTTARLQEERELPVDCYEDEEGYLAVFDAPGADASDVQVRYLDGEVLVRIERFRDFHEGFRMRVPGRGLSLSGSVALPSDALLDVDAASATLTDRGTLEVRIPRQSGGA